MKKLFIKLIKITLSVIALLIVILAIVASIARALFPSLEKYKPQIEQWASTAVHQPVKIGQLTGHWRGLSPVFTLDDVAVLNDDKTQTMIKVKRISVSPNLLKSLIYWRFEPSYINVIGTRLTIHQLNNNYYEVNGIKGQYAHRQSSVNDVEDVLTWILEQGKISLENIDVDWYGKNGLYLPIVDLQLRLTRGFIRHRVIGTAALDQTVPTQFRFVMNLHGDVLNLEELRVDFNLHIKDLSLPQWLKNQTWSGLQLTAGTLNNLQIRGHWSNRQLEQVQTDFNATDLHLAPVNNLVLEKPLAIEKFAANVVCERNGDNWTVAGNHLQLSINQQTLATDQFSLEFSPGVNAKTTQQVLHINIINIRQLTQLAQLTNLVPRVLKNAIINLHPQGELTQVKIVHQGTEFNNKQFMVSANFNNVSFLPWHRLPGLNNLTGQFELCPDHGQAQLSGKQLKLNYNQLFRQSFIIQNYSGTLTWQQQRNSSWQIAAHDIIASTLNANLRGEMTLYLPATKSSPIINIIAGFNARDVANLRDYTPAKILHSQLVDWLDQAFVSGDSINGSMILQGPLTKFPFDNNAGKFQLLIQGHNINFNYKNGWPMITNSDSDIEFDNQAMRVDTNSGKILGDSISSMHAQIADLRKPLLKVQGSMNTDLSNGLRFIIQSPLQKIFGSSFQDLQMHGPIQLGLQLQIPLQERAHWVKVDGNINIAPGAVLQASAWQVGLSHLQGNLHFTENSLSGSNLQAQFLNSPVTINVDTQHTKDSDAINFHFNGRAPVAALLKNYNLSALDFINGSAYYQALLQFRHQGTKQLNTFNVDSNLQGVAIALPKPLRKLAAESVPFNLQINFTDPSRLMLLMNYNKNISAALAYARYKQTWHFANADIRLGGEPAEFTNVPGIILDGVIPQLDWSQLQTDFMPYFNRSQQTISSSFNIKKILQYIKLNIGQINIFGLTIPKAKLKIQPSGMDWLVNIDSAMMSGDIIVPHGYPHQALQADFAHFYLPSLASNDTKQVVPSQIPSFEFNSQDFVYDKRRFGRINLNVSTNSNKLYIKQLHVASPILNLSAQGLWRVDENKQQTKIYGRLTSKDIGQVLKDWGATSSMIGGNGHASFNLSWPGPVFKPVNNALNGQLDMQFRNGRIINIGQSAEAEVGLGRVLNLFSLQTIPRRLTFDFSDLTKKGFSFDIMKGKLLLHNGNAFAEKAYLDGPIAEVNISGRIGLGAKDYDLKMLITPYLTSSLPVIAALTGGPIAGAVTWVATKIVGSAVSKLSQHTYHVTGGWDNPKVQQVKSAVANREQVINNTLLNAR